MFACVPATSAQDVVEKPGLKSGFINLADFPPSAIAKRLILFEGEGLRVTLVTQANCPVLTDRVITGEPGAARILAVLPSGRSAGNPCLPLGHFRENLFRNTTANLDPHAHQQLKLHSENFVSA